MAVAVPALVTEPLPLTIHCSFFFSSRTFSPKPPHRKILGQWSKIKCCRINKTEEGMKLFPRPSALASIIHDPLSRPIAADCDRLGTVCWSFQVADPAIYISGVLLWRRSPSVVHDDLWRIPFCFSLYFFFNLSFKCLINISSGRLSCLLCDGFDVRLHFPLPEFHVFFICFLPEIYIRWTLHSILHSLTSWKCTVRK